MDVKAVFILDVSSTSFVFSIRFLQVSRFTRRKDQRFSLASPIWHPGHVRKKRRRVSAQHAAIGSFLSLRLSAYPSLRSVFARSGHFWPGIHLNFRGPRYLPRREEEIITTRTIFVAALLIFRRSSPSLGIVIRSGPPTTNHHRKPKK